MTHPKNVAKFDMDIAEAAKARHTVKAYTEDTALPAETVAKLKDLLRFSASSTNLQPWHFVMASTPEGKDRIAKAGTDEKYPFNSPSIRKSSHVVLFAGRTVVDEDYLLHVLEQEDEDGRFPEPKNKDEFHGARSMFVNLHKDMGDVGHWMDKQVYWNGGQFLLGAAALGVDATPMEGIDMEGLDKEFGLTEKGYSSLFIVCLGRNDDEQDYNAGLPKSRLPLSETLTEI
jgi:nitroreductase/dihydropteridine reductase